MRERLDLRQIGRQGLMAGKKTRIMYIEQKTGANAGEARIGRVTFSGTGRTLYYRDKAFQPARGKGICGNYYGYERAVFEKALTCTMEASPATPEGRRRGPLPGLLGEFWISGPKKNGQDRHACQPCGPVIVDEDVAEEYWKDIRETEGHSG